MDTLEWPRAGARPHARFAQRHDYHPSIVGLAAVVGLAMLLTAVNAGGQAWVWECVHWTVTPGLAALIASRGARRAVGHERSVRLAVTASLVLWGLGQVVWDVQAMAGWDLIAAPSDVLFIASIVPAVWAVGIAGKRHLKGRRPPRLRLDALVVLVATTTVILATFGRDAIEVGGAAGLLFLVYPISYSATAGAGLVTAVARRARASTYILLAGAALQGIAWVAWLPAVILHVVKPGTIPGYLFSVSLLLIGVGAARWPGRASHDRRMRRAAGIAREALPMAAVVVAMLPILAFARDAMGDATALGAGTVAALALGRQSLLLVDRARRTNRERITHLRELRAQAALREAADRRTADAAWLAGLKPGDNLMETLEMLCAEIVALPQWDAAGMLAIDAEGALETLVSVGGVPAALEANPGLLGLIAPEDGPWIGRLGERDATPFVVVSLRNGGSAVGLIWAVPVAGTSEAWLESRKTMIHEFAAFAAALAGKDLLRRRSVQRSRRAIEQVIADRAFFPVFQPVVDLATRDVLGYEALTRFEDGVRPDVRFADAAEVGLGIALEAITLRAAFSAAKDLPNGAWLSVNASPQMLLAVVPLVAALEGLELELVVEVTEHVAVDDYGRLREAIALLGPRVDLSIDDAGSGYASLRHILELAPRFVKLDTSLVGAIDTDPARQAIVAGLVHFATTTGCELIAEGIETESQLETLRCLGIRLGQGYLLGRPEPLPTDTRGVKVDPRSGGRQLRHQPRI